MEAHIYLGFPHSSVGKESVCSAGDLGSIPGLGRSSEEGNGNPLQCSCLKNPLDRGAWRATVHGDTWSQTQLKQLSTHMVIMSVKVLKLSQGLWGAVKKELASCEIVN